MESGPVYLGRSIDPELVPISQLMMQRSHSLAHFPQTIGSLEEFAEIS